MNKVVVFGTGTMAKLAWRCFEEETQDSVAAFCVDDDLYDRSEFCGVPVVRASRVAQEYPPADYKIFIALGYQSLNSARKFFFEKYMSNGYNFASCVSSHAMIKNHGNIGKNCFIMEGSIVQAFSTIGDNCVLWSGCVVSHESTISDHCFLAAHSVVGGMTSIGEQSFLGMNCTVRDGVHVGKKCLVGAGSLVVANIADNSLIAEKATPIAPFSAEQALRFIDI